MLGAFSSRLKTLRRRMREESRRGSAAVEFAMIAPVFFLFLFGIIETGVIYFAQSTLTNSVEDAARMVRTGQLKGTLTADQMKQAVCGSFASSSDGSKLGLMSWQTCLNTLQVDMRVFDGFGGATYPNVIKDDGSLDVNNMTVQAADACRVVLFRAYYPWHILTPFLAPLMSNMPSGTDMLLGAAEAFRTEPYPDANRQANAVC
ncbi:MAG TPA: TadE/TadG family type IV pilus assembly protein [Rhizomicrobium sp.]|nr:TadE/TadG family type IV pilus assembly protein [Rhizomicrobium sp.]